jgi:cell fate regulator YaaT (PSP1 superfamily)
MQLPGGQEPFNLVEVRFKNSRKEYFRNQDKLPLKIGDLVATEAQSGHDIGQVTLTGELVRFQLKKKKIKENSEEILKIYRMASQKDIDKWQTARDREAEVQKRAREMAIFLRLEMKISDVEFQGDGSKATFYYTAENRVDFRQLIKDMAQAFSVRIEMKQIGLRQEASRLGGIGSCGRELCCSTWLTDFRTVSTAAARYQQLSLNPEKLAGQCGKLKCCLNFELDAYRKALKTFPKLDAKLHTEKGIAVCQKTDIFKGYMWYAYKGDWMTWHLLTNEQAAEIVRKNKAKEPVASLEEYVLDLPPAKTEEKVFENVVGQDSLNRFDRPKQSKNKKSRNKKPRNRNRNRKAPQKNE